MIVGSIKEDLALTKLLSIGADVGGKDTFIPETTSEKLLAQNAGKSLTSVLSAKNLLNSDMVEKENLNFLKTSQKYQTNILSRINTLRTKLKNEKKEFLKTGAALDQSHQVVSNFDAGVPYEDEDKSTEVKTNENVDDLEQLKIELLSNMCYILEYYRAKCAKSHKFWLWKTNARKITDVIQRLAAVRIQTRCKMNIDKDTLNMLQKGMKLKTENGGAAAGGKELSLRLQHCGYSKT